MNLQALILNSFIVSVSLTDFLPDFLL